MKFAPENPQEEDHVGYLGICGKIIDMKLIAVTKQFLSVFMNIKSSIIYMCPIVSNGMMKLNVQFENGSN
jgi:hypothetical protein